MDCLYETRGPCIAADAFYVDVLQRLQASGIPFLVAGAFALQKHTGISRRTKDLDLFCEARDYPRIIDLLGGAGYHTEITDPSWIAKAFDGDAYVDVIFRSRNGLCEVDEGWFERSLPSQVLGQPVRILSAEDMIWSKAFVQDRDRFDGPDIYHVIRRRGRTLDWRYLLGRMEPHWEALLFHLIGYRFVYPSERDAVPEWLLRELLSRVEQQLTAPPLAAMAPAPAAPTPAGPSHR